MEGFFWVLPIPEGENIFSNLFGDDIDFDGWNENWDGELEEYGFVGFIFGYGFMTCLEHFNHITNSLMV